MPLDITIDRPKGTKKKFQTPQGVETVTYPCDYGYFTGVHNPDDEEGADVFVGTGKLCGRFHKGDNLSGTWKRDERKWYLNLTTQELDAVRGMYGDDLLREWATFESREELEEDVLGITKTASSALRRAIQIVDHGVNAGGMRNWRMLLKGQDIGGAYARRVPGGFQLGGVDRLPKQYAGLGLGKKLYGDMMKSLTPGETLYSDSIVSGGAQAVWESLKRRIAPWFVSQTPGGIPQPANGNARYGFQGLEFPAGTQPTQPGVKPYHYAATRTPTPPATPVGAQALRQTALQ